MTLIPQTLTDEQAKAVAWSKAKPCPGIAFSENEWRYDDEGNLIRWSDYGDQKSAHGWQIDHSPIPQCEGGQTVEANIRALHHGANARNGAKLGQARSLFGALSGLGAATSQPNNVFSGRGLAGVVAQPSRNALAEALETYPGAAYNALLRKP
ncbi:MAG: hypothetical protein JWP35_4684 [Caulobacter sp.]|nr:hypothetical protein [Caulobacter sp.]